MGAADRIRHEVKAILLAALYFAAWLGALLFIKSLILEEYHIRFHHYSMALVGALVLSKVVLVLEHVSLGAWLRSRPAWVEVVLRTALYGVGVFAVLVLEKGIEGRHDHGGFGGAVEAAFKGSDAPHVLANLICLTGALLIWNAASVVEQHLGKRGLARLFTVPLPQEKQKLPGAPASEAVGK